MEKNKGKKFFDPCDIIQRNKLIILKKKISPSRKERVKKKSKEKEDNKT